MFMTFNKIDQDQLLGTRCHLSNNVLGETHIIDSIIDR